MNKRLAVSHLQKALSFFGTETAMASALGLKQQSVNDVFRAGRPAPPKWCIPLERLTNGLVTRSQLRPDIYPLEDERAA